MLHFINIACQFFHAFFYLVFLFFFLNNEACGEWQRGNMNFIVSCMLPKVKILTDNT